MSFYELGILFPIKWRYTLPIPRLTSHLQYGTESPLSVNASLCLDSSQYAIIFNPSLINIDIFYLCDKALNLTLSNINISDPKREYGSFNFWSMKKKKILELKLKCLFSNPCRWKFLAILVPHMPKITFYF